MLSPHYTKAIELSDAGIYSDAIILWKEHLNNLKIDSSSLERFFVHYYYADALGELEQEHEAIKVLREALNILPKVDENEDFILSINIEICRLLFSQEKFEEAEKIRLSIWSEMLQMGRFFEAYNLAADRYVFMPENSTVLFDEVMSQILHSEDTILLHQIYRDYAVLLLSQKRFEDLLVNSQKVRTLLQNISEVNTSTYIFTWLNEFEVYYERREYDILRIALSNFRENIDFKYPIDNIETVHLLFFEAVIYLVDKQLQVALDHLTKAHRNAEFDEELKLKVLEKSYQALTVHYHYNEAIPLAKQALKVACEYDDYTHLDIAVDLAQIYNNANEFQKAIDLLSPIEESVLSLEDEELTQRFFSLLTTSAEQLPDARIFEHARHKWFDLSQNLSDQNSFDFYFEYARILLNLNQTEQALKLFDQAEEIAIKLNWEYHFPAINIEKAICESRLNQYEKSYGRLIEMTPPTLLHLNATYLNILADCQSELNQEKEAIENYKKTIVLVEKHPFLFHYASTAYSNMGLIEHSNKEYLKAEKLYRKGLDYDVEGGITQQQITAHYNLGTLYIDWGRMEEAEKHLWKALKLINNTYGDSKSTLDQKNISDDWFTIIELLVEVLLDKGDKGKALRLLLHKNSIFSDLNYGKLDFLPLPQLLPNQQMIAYSGIRRERMFIFHLTCNGLTHSLKISVKKITFSEESEKDLPEVLKNAVKIFRKQNLKKLGKRDKDYRNSYPWMARYLHYLCAIPNQKKTPRSLNNQKLLFDVFSKILIAPICDLLDVQNLIISPDYILGSLPFGALFISTQNKTRLIEKFNISLFGGLTNDLEQEPQSENVIIFGATKYSHKMKLTDLPAGILEVKNILQIFPKSINLVDETSELIIDNLLSEIEINKPKYLHFIGHATDKYPESVIYYPFTSEGIIPLSAIRKLLLNGTTVYVSSCLSANGQAYAGWGIDSVARSFLDAGATTVISLLFPLSDDLSPLLVSEIYNKFHSGDSPEVSISSVQRLCLNGRFGSQYQSVLTWGSLVCIKCLETSS